MGFWCGALELKGDVPLLLPIGRNGFDRVNLLAIAEGNLDAEGAIGGEWHHLTADGEAG
jgi:hypothetical protein